MDAVWCETTTPSFPRKRESSLSNSLRVADKAVFTVLFRCVRVFICPDSRFRGNDDCFNVYVMNYVKINRCAYAFCSMQTLFSARAGEILALTWWVRRNSGFLWDLTGKIDIDRSATVMDTIVDPVFKTVV